MATIRAKVAPQNTIKTRVGQQNAVKVLTNATAPPSKLINLDDVNQDFRTTDGMILVWDLPSQSFIMTSVIDSSSTTIEGIVYFQNETDSSLPTNGALVVSGGVGIAKNLNVGLGLSVTGLSTFSSNVDINSSVDILNNLNVIGLSTFAGVNISSKTTITGETTITGDTNITGTLGVDGLVSTTEGLYYETSDINLPNGMAYFDNTGKLVTSPQSDNSIDTSNYILTTQTSNKLPVWTTTIDGGSY
jgi:hypothetical protein